MKKKIIILVIAAGMIGLVIAFHWNKIKTNEKSGASAGIQNILQFKKHVDYFDGVYEDITTDLAKNNINEALEILNQANERQKKDFTDYGDKKIQRLKFDIASWYLKQDEGEKAKAFVNKYGLEKNKKNLLESIGEEVDPELFYSYYDAFQQEYFIYSSKKQDVKKAKDEMKKGNYMEAYNLLHESIPRKNYFVDKVKANEKICVDKLIPKYSAKVKEYANAGMFEKANFIMNTEVADLINNKDSRWISLQSYIKTMQDKIKVSFTDSINILNEKDSKIGGNVIFSNVVNSYVLYSHPSGAVNFVISEENGVLNGQSGYLFDIQNTEAENGEFTLCNKEYYAFVNNQTGKVSYYTGKINFKETYKKLLFGTTENLAGKTYFTVYVAKGVLINYLLHKGIIKPDELNNIENIYGNTFKILGNEPYQEFSFNGINYVVSLKEIYTVKNGEFTDIAENPIKL